MTPVLSRELLSILCCPKCLGSLSEVNDQTQLTCLNCHSMFAVENGIPIMLADHREQSTGSNDRNAQRRPD